MPKTNYVPVQGLDPVGGEKPVGVQTRLKAATGPFIPRSIDFDGGVVLIVTCKRGDVTLKHIDDLPVQREDLIAGEILEVAPADLQITYDVLTRARSERDRAISVASGYDGTFDEPGTPVHADADGTVLTPQEVAARQGHDGQLIADEAAAWWEEQSYINLDFGEVTETELADLVAKVPLNEVELIQVLDAQLADGDDPGRPKVLEAINARLAAHADAVNAPGWSPLEDGLPIVEVRRRLAAQGDARIVAGWLDAETAGKGRKRLRQALQERLEQIGEAPEVEPLPDIGDGPVGERVAEGTGEEMVAVEGDTLPPLPGEEGPAVDEDPFG